MIYNVSTALPHCTEYTRVRHSAAVQYSSDCYFRRDLNFARSSSYMPSRCLQQLDKPLALHEHYHVCVDSSLTVLEHHRSILNPIHVYVI